MTKLSRSEKDKCPCWLLDGKRECAVVDGGVFIPLPHHVLLYCQTSRYSQCSQFIRGQTFVLNKETGERRRAERYAKQIHFRIHVSDPSRSPPLESIFDSRTLDIGPCGMRMESPEMLTRDSLITFETESEFADLKTGSGLVKWCRPRSDSGSFEFGLAFPEGEGVCKAVNKLLFM